MIMAAALLLMTQCRKEEMPAVMPEANTVRMTVTAGPGSKTDISAAGAIKWSDNDKIYVGHNGTYVGYLTLVSSAGSATGTFSGDVALTGITDGTEQTFHFYYLGSAERTLAVGDGSAEVDFSSQNIYNNDGKLENANAQHVGYGSASGTVKDGVVTGINVTLVSKVALARFSFKKGDADYTDALTLSGDKIYNNMTVGFDGTFTGKKTDGGKIKLTNTTTSEKYVMLVPAGTDSNTLNFVGGDMTGSTKLENGIEANKFYGRESAIEVTVTKYVPKFTVDKDGTTVEFAPGNLWYGIADGESTPAFHFEANQWSTKPTSNGQWDESHVSHFFWSDAANAVTGDYSYSGDLFFTEASGFEVNGETANTWRTLSRAEWNYLLGFDPEQWTQTETYGRPGAKAKSAWKDLGGGVKGLVILPDDTENPSTVMSGITSTSHLASSGAVFLPAAGDRFESDVNDAGSLGYYWSGTPDEGYDDNSAYRMYFDSSDVDVLIDARYNGYSVRLVR